MKNILLQLCGLVSPGNLRSSKRDISNENVGMCEVIAEGTARSWKLQARPLHDVPIQCQGGALERQRDLLLPNFALILNRCFV